MIPLQPKLSTELTKALRYPKDSKVKRRCYLLDRDCGACYCQAYLSL